MTQKTNKLYNLLTIPFLYSFIQKIFSGESVRKNLVRNYIKKKNVSVLDIGCGTAEILEILPGSKYFGYDIEPKYINYAKLKYEKKGKFYCKKFTSKEIKKLPKFDYVLYFGGMSLARKQILPAYVVVFFPSLVAFLIGLGVYKKLDWMS